MEHEVIVYTTPTCPWCQVVKRYLEERNIPYREVDVSTDMEAAMEIIRKSGQQGVPVVEIDGEIVVGFDRERIDALLGLH
ncbi:glutaredoxin family protein [Candidatus Bipolaricaulota bacterium]|nr:glutaredoxin family protein [Candidatus Bipolaricaulota bacterium]